MNEPITQEDKECVYKFWEHDKDDLDQDVDLIGFLGGKPNKKKKKTRHLKSKSKAEQPQLEDISPRTQNVIIEEPKRELSPKKFTKIMTELNLNSHRREIPSPVRVQQKSPVLIEDTLPNHLIHLNPQPIDPTPVQPIKKHHVPSNSLQMNGPMNYYKYRPSFNAGAPFNDQQSIGGGGSIETNNNTVKLSDFIARKSTKLLSSFPHLPPHHGEHQNLPTNLMIPLKQYAEQDTLDEYDVETTKYSSNKSIYPPTLSKIKTPHQGSSIAPTNWGEVNFGSGRISPQKEFQERAGRTYDNANNILVTDNSPTYFRRTQNRQSHSVIQPVPVDQTAGIQNMQKGQIMPTPLLQYNLPLNHNFNDGSRRSLIKLPTISTSKGPSMDNSPGKASPLLFDKTPMGGAGRQYNRDQREPRDQSGSPFLVERKLSRFMSNGHIRNDLSIFKASAARQLQEFAN